MKKNRLARLTIPLLLILGAGVALAQVSANYNLSWNLLSGGGGSRASTGYRLDDSLGQWPGNPSASTAYRVDPGFWPGTGTGGGGALPTPTPTATPGPTPPAGSDAYELDNTCGVANSITTDGFVQAHNFYAAGDYDWVKFSALANRTYNILVDNVGTDADAVIVLYDACADAPLGQAYNAFGTQVQLQWSAASAGVYYLQLFQNDPAVAGSATGYNLSISTDSTPPAAPRSVRLAPADSRLIVQWRQSAEPDVIKYRVRWGTTEGVYGSYDTLDGAGNTYYEITGLVNATIYHVVVQAVDYSENVSLASVDVAAIPAENLDPTGPTLAMNLPGSGGTYTTTAASIAVGGYATDATGNLSRAKAYNSAGSGATVWQNGLSGSAITFTVPSVPLQVGTNNIQLRVYDAVSNSATTNVTVVRRPPGNGVAVIIGGHNESYGLQTKINNLTNRAYRIFVEAGFDPAKIRYLAPSSQDPDGDGDDDVYAHTTTAAITATLQWAATQVSSGTPFFLYMMDHGMSEAFCADGCPPSGDGLTPDMLSGLLDGIESQGGVVSVIIEACLSGSFIDDPHSISKAGRVIISSTSANQNAYASAQGAYFSDAFYSSAASGASLLTAFNAGKAAVAAASVNQAPWMDDNHSHSYDGSDGGTAGLRFLSTNFGTVPPYISMAAVNGTGTSRVISATVLAGDAVVHSVWAAVYAPSFQEPSENTLDLGVPLVELFPDPEVTDLYTATYSAFSEAGSYRVVVYAADVSDNEAAPRVVGGGGAGGSKAYLPLVARSSTAGAGVQGIPSPPPLPSPTATATSAPTATATPAPSVTSTPTPASTGTPVATATVATTATAAATATPEPTLTPTATATAAAVPTQMPPPPSGRGPLPTPDFEPGREGTGYLPMVVRLE